MGVIDRKERTMKKIPPVSTRRFARTLRKNMTDAERLLWSKLKAEQIAGCRFRRQVPIGHYIVDFACHQARLVIELDGGQHDLSAEKEKQRTAFLNGQGYRVLRFWNNEINENIEGACQSIMNMLSENHPHPTLPHQGGGLSLVTSDAR